MSIPPSGILWTHMTQWLALQLAWLAQWIEHCVWPMQRSGFDSQSSLNFFQVIFFFKHFGCSFYSDDNVHFLRQPNKENWHPLQASLKSGSKDTQEIDPSACDLTAAEIGEKGKTESCPNHCTGLFPSNSLGIGHMANNQTPPPLPQIPAK